MNDETINQEPDDVDTNASVDVAVASEPVKQDTAAPAPSTTKTPKRAPSHAGQAVSGNDVDQVLLSACVFKNPAARKSLSVHHVQRRLSELGYPDAYTDKDGWYGDLTMKAVREYQADNSLAGDGLVDAVTLEHLFSDDPNVVVVV